MKGYMFVILYFAIAIIYIIIGSFTFKPVDGDFEITTDGYAIEKDEEIQRSDMVMRGMFWPLVVFATLLFCPIVMIDRISTYIVRRRRR